MADTKMTALPVATSMSSDDLMHKVDDPSGSPANQKIAWSNLITQIETDIGKAAILADITAAEADIDAAEADILTNAGDIATNAAAITVLQGQVGNLEYGQIYADGNTVGQTLNTGSYTKLTQFTDDGLESANITVSAANNKITIERTGIYLIIWHIGFSGDPLVEWLLAPFVDGTRMAAGTIKCTIRSSSDIEGSSGFAIYDATTQPLDVDLRAQPDTNGEEIVLEYGTLFLERIADT